MVKEIHFYTNLCNEKQISDKEITDVYVDYVSTYKAICEEVEIIRTTQLSFLKNSWHYVDAGIKVFIHNSTDVFEIKEGMNNPLNKDISRFLNISNLLLGGTFGDLE